MKGDREICIDAGMNDHVTKPIDPDQLFAALRKWIRPATERAAVPKSLPASGETPVLNTPPESDPTVPDKDGLPESLPGFDLVDGLKRLQGNRRLYRKLLLDFNTQYASTAEDIQRALVANDIKQVHSLVHNIKGLAGNLEATGLQAAAAELEKIVRGRTEKTIPDKGVTRKFAELENAVQHALAAVGTLGPSTDKRTGASNKAAIESVPPELIQKATDNIKMAVELGDVIKIKSIAEKLKSDSDAMIPICDELIQMAEDFDFDGIQKIVPKLN